MKQFRKISWFAASLTPLVGLLFVPNPGVAQAAGRWIIW